MMAIRILLDHGVPESHITFLAFLISRQGLFSVRRAFPEVTIVTAAIDPGLHEMHLPLGSRMMGEAAGEADFAVRLVDDSEDAQEHEDAADATDIRPNGDFRNAIKTEHETTNEGFKVPIKKEMQELQFSRRKRRDTMPLTEKRAWVITPGEYGS